MPPHNTPHEPGAAGAHSQSIPPIPPPYSRQNPSAAPRKEKSLIPWVLAGCGCLGLVGFVALAAVLLPVFAAARKNAIDRACMQNLQQMSLAVRMYSQDWDERLPAAVSWMDAVLPYTSKEDYMRCPVISRENPALYGYAYNERLSAFPEGKIASKATTPMLFDSTILMRNAADDGHSFAASPPRHGSATSGSKSYGGAIGFADGHVALLPSFPRRRSGTYTVLVSAELGSDAIFVSDRD
jgi:hypothetical protein